MEGKRLKQRIIGGLVLAAITGILVAVLVGREARYEAELQEGVPPEPEGGVVTEEVPVDELREQTKREIGAGRGLVEEAPAPELPSTPTRSEPGEEKGAGEGAAPSPPQPAPKPSPEAASDKPTDAGSSWLVQVASFAQRANAEGLQERLHERGYEAFVEASENGQHLQVKVGPRASRAEAEVLRERLQEEMGFDGLVRRQP